MTASVQAKPAISRPGDLYEQEADRVAEQVMRMPAATMPQNCAPCESGGTADPRHAKERLGLVQRRARGNRFLYNDFIPSGFVEDLGAGRPLDTATRLSMESRFGEDFTRVRVLADDKAASSARQANALAYTVGPNVVFGTGQYAPGTATGDRLLAHELTHVLQQESTGPRLQRQPDDFRVTQVQPDPQSRTRGMPARFFFELDRSDFRADVPAEAAERDRLVAWAGAHTGQHVQLIGRASQEGAPEHNRVLAQQRAATVRGVLVAHGVIVDGTPQIDMTFSQRPVEYRFYRSVEVIVAGSTEVSCRAFTAAQRDQDVADCETAFNAAHRRADVIANAGIARLRPGTDPNPAPAPDRDSVISDRFRGIARATLLPRFESILTRLGETRPAAGHACAHRCAPRCERPASAGVGGPIELCPSFYIPGFRGRTLSADERVHAVLHETTHSAVAPGGGPPASVGIDVAYAHTRLFGVLEGAEALRNADSYVAALLMLARNAGGAAAVLTALGVGPADNLRLVTPAGEAGDRNRTARRAIGYAGSWLNYASFWTPNLYDFIAASLAGWSVTGLGRNGHVMLELFAPLFRLRHPGTADLPADGRSTVVTFQTEVAGRGFPTPPVSSRAQVEDRTRTAGVYDRLSRMHRNLGSPLTVDRAAAGDGSWASAPGLPGLGVEVRLADSFFSLSPPEQTRQIIRLMARAMGDVGAAWVEAYVEAADGVHRYRGIGP